MIMIAYTSAQTRLRFGIRMLLRCTVIYRWTWRICPCITNDKNISKILVILSSKISFFRHLLLVFAIRTSLLLLSIFEIFRLLLANSPQNISLERFLPDFWISQDSERICHILIGSHYSICFLQWIVYLLVFHVDLLPASAREKRLVDHLLIILHVCTRCYRVGINGIWLKIHNVLGSGVASLLIDIAGKAFDIQLLPLLLFRPFQWLLLEFQCVWNLILQTLPSSSIYHINSTRVHRNGTAAFHWSYLTVLRDDQRSLVSIVILGNLERYKPILLIALALCFHISQF